MAQCIQCSSSIPDEQRTCSMCYGDPDHGRDGYYRKWLEDQWLHEEAQQAELEREKLDGNLL